MFSCKFYLPVFFVGFFIFGFSRLLFYHLYLINFDSIGKEFESVPEDSTVRDSAKSLEIELGVQNKKHKKSKKSKNEVPRDFIEMEMTHKI